MTDEINWESTSVLGFDPDAEAILDPLPPTFHLLPLCRELKIVTKERGVVRFGDIMNPAQIDIIQNAEHQLRSTGRIRTIVLKARQIGISTAIEAIIFVLTTIFDSFQGLVVSHEKDSAEHILSMTRTYWKTFMFGEFLEEEYAGKTHLSWSNTGSGLQVATARNVDAGRSRTLHALHASEAAFYDDPESLMNSLSQAIPAIGITAIFIESTANGIGNFFHKTYVEAQKEINEHTALFYPWWTHPEYTATMLAPDVTTKYQLGTLKDEERVLVSLMRAGFEPLGIAGYTEEEITARLIWRRYTIVNYCQGNLDKFKQEHPATWHEAFLSTGRNVFYLPNLLAHYKPMRGTRGRLIMRGRRVTFIDDPDGWLTIFAYPSKDRNWGVYIGGADPTHTQAGDFACCQVFNRRTLEQVAVYRRHTNPFQFAKDLFLLGLWYHEAMLIPECEGPGHATTGQLVGMNYPYVWERQHMAKTPGKVSEDTWGWSTNVATKHLAIQALVSYLSEPLVQIGDETFGVVLHDEMTFSEMRDYITTENGRGYENSDGSPFDDGVMAAGIAIAVHDWEPKPDHYTGPGNSNPHAPEEKPMPIKPVKAPQDRTVQDVIDGMHTDPTAPEYGEDHGDESGPVDPATLEAPYEQWDDYDREAEGR